MAKRLIKDYQFVASAKTITFPTLVTVDGLLLVTNVTKNIVIYNFSDATVGGTWAGNVLTLVYDTSAAMLSTDTLQIWFDDGVATPTESADVISLMQHQLLVLKEIRTGILLLLNLVDTSGPSRGYDVDDLTAQDEGVH